MPNTLDHYPDCPSAQNPVRHDFGQGRLRPAEHRTLAVAVLTLAVMFCEVIGGWITGSMALLADGVHMAGHAVALGLAASAYYLSRQHAEDRRLSLGSGKIGDLAAYSSALLLGASTLWLIVESVHRLFEPEPLMPLEALVVAVIGLLVNVASIWILEGGHDHDHAHRHHHAGGDHGSHHSSGSHDHSQPGDSDHNLRAAVTHLMADVLTSLAAIVGLFAAWQWGWWWLDPAIALVAALVILRWAFVLMRQTGGILLDSEAPQALRRRVRERLQSLPDSQVVDLHLWSVGQGGWTLMGSILTHHPHSPDDYKATLIGIDGLYHPVIEVNHCRECLSKR
ncbi:MAG: CDF family Co(II)/Ni(II) efflux transporter DmeF [Candidatus Thiodiazotropha sp. (ex Ctena orbiculata)]|nr:CDF family Co(II)/Ni(II) efflux transporter DmeF [Candidatus Thiodiazotropha taylori]